ncbi:diphosphomevalonate decarboxylase [Dietzia sp.]|uniref:diphosphomevalonate decarboxylase n=1 Tax=Dietzia sp. TaxID=1871616 RepID=UPI002FDB779D
MSDPAMSDPVPGASAPGDPAQTLPAGVGTARSFPNMALVKYWGKRDEAMMLPAAGSISMTFDTFATTTRVELDVEADADTVELNGAIAEGDAAARVVRFLDLIRELAGSETRAHVRTFNEAPTAAGLASSASGFSALAVAATGAYGLDLDTAALSRLARRGSGSAARSVVDGMAIWHAGDTDAESFSEPIDAPAMRLVIVTVNGEKKEVSSREAMRRTAATSPFYAGWIECTEETLGRMVDACAAGDFEEVGAIAETHALRMHAVIQSCDPPIRYLLPRSVEIFDAVARLRREGTPAYATADAGPNVAVLVRPEDADAVAAELGALGPVRVVGPGRGAHPIPDAEALAVLDSARADADRRGE